MENNSSQGNKLPSNIGNKIVAPEQKITLTLDQEQGMDKILSWYDKSPELVLKNESPTFELGGYAGTGKTTLISSLIDELQLQNIAVVAYTGRAAMIAKSKFMAFGNRKYTPSFSTIHSLIYSPVIDNQNVIVGWEKRELDYRNCPLIIVDESSMVDEDIRDDLESYNIPILYVGDPGQLPPIKGDLSKIKRDHVLETITRTSKDNPLILLADRARKGLYIKPGTYGDGIKVLYRAKLTSRAVIDFYNEVNNTYVLTDTNARRVTLNTLLANNFGPGVASPDNLLPGHRVICLQNTRNVAPRIYNGELGFIDKIHNSHSSFYIVDLMSDSGNLYHKVAVPKRRFNGGVLSRGDYILLPKNSIQLDFGYSMTVHKSQGGESDNVIIIGDGACFKKFKKNWLYTAITRSKNRLLMSN